ncbi:MAG TPA: porin family protein [Bacteroidales bacterium]
MKKITFLLAGLLLTGMVYGQKKLTFGPQIGFASSNLTTNVSEISNSARSNFLVGAFLRYGKKIYLQPEVNWLTQGSEFKYSLDSLSASQSVKLKSVQVPLAIGWRIINLKVVNIRLYGGVAANFITNVTISTENGNNNDYLIPDDFNNVQWQYMVGAGVDVLFLAVNFSYLGGINDIMNADVTYNNQTQSISSKSNLFQITLAWKIL